MKMRRWLLWAGLLLLGGTARAAEQREVYDLAKCIRAALANSPDVKGIAADLAAARARLAEARAGRLGEGEYTQVVGLVNRARGNAVFSPDDKNDLFEGLGPFTRIELDLRIPLYTFGKLEAALEAAEQGLQSERARGEATRAEVILSTKRLYYGLLLARQLGSVLHDMLDQLDKAVAKTQQRLDAGSKSVTELDLLKLKIGRAKFAKGVLEVDASTELSRAALARAIGLDSAAPLEIADRRLQPVEAALDPLDTYLNEGPARRPEWRQLSAGIAAQSAKLALEEASYYPSFFFATGVHVARAGNRTEQDNAFASDEFNFLRPIGAVGVRWDLNFMTTNARVAQARADLERLQAQQHAATSGLQVEIRRAYSDVMQARETIGAAEDGRKAGRGLLILTVANFDLGIGEAEELFNGLGAYTEASTDYFRAVHDYNVALGALSKAVGKELSAIEY